MDDDFERALAASRSENAEQVEEDRQLQEAIRLSKLDGGDMASQSSTESASSPRERSLEDHKLQEAIDLSKEDNANVESQSSTASENSPREPSIGGKRKAEDVGIESVKRARPTKAAITYPEGALRITRTPGRQDMKNCINLDDVIQGKDLVSACVFSFFIGGDELYDHFPLSHSSDAVPIYIGRDVNMDPMAQEACQQAGITFPDKLGSKQLATIAPNLRQLYTKQYGKNYHAFYAWSSGSSHSKILLLVYPDFLRFVITSCNMMDIDTVLGDNHWYIHDLPKLSTRSTPEPSPFESDLISHLQALSTPTQFQESIIGRYDYSKVKVHLVTSAPGVCAGIKAEKHGLLRLRRVIQDLDLKLPRDSEKFQLEACAASIGNLNAKWLNGFYDCAVGKETIGVVSEDNAIPALKLFYPSVGDVKKADPSAQDAASNIGCHTRPWDNAPSGIKNIFHHYESKDTGRLFHQKLILAYNPQDLKAAPYFVYIGSANLSQSAWGALEQDKKSNKITCDKKLIKISNFECGVIIPGHIVESLLEPGTRDWQSGIVPYVQTGKRYESKDRPWNDPRWVKDYQG